MTTHIVCGIPMSVTSSHREIARVLQDELSVYPVTDALPALACRVHAAWEPSAMRGRLLNPSIHSEEEDGFVAAYRGVSVRYRFVDSQIRQAEMYLAHNRSGMERTLRRWISIQYTDLQESVGQLLHELVVVPAIFTRPSLVPLHAAAITLGDKVVLLGGTGGVGKTTLATLACLHHRAAFVADDISVVDEQGFVHPNLAYPKVYAYNLETDEELRQRVWIRRGVLDRLHWRLRRLLGPGSVRRRVSPRDLLGSYSALPQKLGAYAVLVRDRSQSRPEIESMGALTAARISVAIMRTEYEIFFRHLAWHAFNRLSDGTEPRIELPRLFERWQGLLADVLAQTTSVMIRVPDRLAPGDRLRLVDALREIAERKPGSAAP